MGARAQGQGAAACPAQASQVLLRPQAAAWRGFPSDIFTSLRRSQGVEVDEAEAVEKGVAGDQREAAAKCPGAGEGPGAPEPMRPCRQGHSGCPGQPAGSPPRGPPGARKARTDGWRVTDPQTERGTGRGCQSQRPAGQTEGETEREGHRVGRERRGESPGQEEPGQREAASEEAAAASGPRAGVRPGRRAAGRPPAS